MPISNRVWNANAIPSMFSEHFEPAPQLSPAQKQRQRALRFEETLSQRFSRIMRAVWASITKLPLVTTLRVIDAVMRDKTVRGSNMIDPQHALAEPDGFCSLLEDVSAVSLMDVYERGAFVDSGVASASCWAPAMRRVARIEHMTTAGSEVHGRGHLTIDADFDHSISLCNLARKIGFSSKLLHGFCTLFDAGMAHSIELRDDRGEINAVLFGIAVGRIFVVQGQYSANSSDRQTLTAYLQRLLQQRNFLLIDYTPIHELEGAQFEVISRTDFTQILTDNLALSGLGRWRISTPTGGDLAIAA